MTTWANANTPQKFLGARKSLPVIEISLGCGDGSCGCGCGDFPENRDNEATPKAAQSGD